jgi:3-oxoacyl-[acyl-carrier-protein] synthase III
MQVGQAATCRNARIAGVVSCVPRRVISNDYFIERFGDKVAEAVKLTGVNERRVVEAGTTTVDLCERAGQSLLQGLSWDPVTVDALVFVSQTPDYRLPASACVLQDRLGIRPGIIAFDVSLGCSGYPYALWLASMMIESGAAKRVLLAVGDTISSLVDQSDRATALLFGDAGTMTALEHSPSDNSVSTYVLGTDGSGAGNLIVANGAARTTVDERASGPALDKLYMDGGEVFNFTLKAVPALISETFSKAGYGVDDYDAFLLHQANAFMIRHLAKKAKLPPDKVPMNIDRFGNTSSATIPLLMTDMLASELRTSPMRLAMFGFGVGLSWASASIEVGALGFIETIEL